MLITQVKHKKEKPKAVNFKVPEAVKKLLQNQADKYAEGNLTEWLVFAGTHFKPAKDHLAPTPKKKK